MIFAAQPSECIYISVEAWLTRYKILHDGSRQIIDFILPGDVFGVEACVFKASLYTVSTVAAGLARKIDCKDLDGLVDRDQSFGKMLLWYTLSDSVRIAEHATNTGRRSAFERISHFLLELYVRLKSVGLAQHGSFCTPLTQELIADAIGLTTIHTNRTVRRLREEGLIVVDGKRISIPDFAALARVCDFDAAYLGAGARALRQWSAAKRDAA